MQSLANMLLEPGALAQVSTDIFSVIPAAERDHHYDKTAAIYDKVIGNRFYNRIIWGNWPSDYETFCKSALTSRKHGPVLDAGCGSLVFTAKAYCECTRPAILMDRSLGMLHRARERLVTLAGEVPDHITLLQADIFDLPFVDHTFSTVQSFGMLHLFGDTDRLLKALLRVNQDSGSLFLSSLAANNALAKRYLTMLKSHGELTLVEPSETLLERANRSGSSFSMRTIGNMAYLSHDGES